MNENSKIIITDNNNLGYSFDEYDNTDDNNENDDAW